MHRIIATTGFAFCLLSLGPVRAQDQPTLEIAWPKGGSVIELGNDPERSIGVVVGSNFTLLHAGECGDNRRCGHVHMKIDPDGGDLIKARFGHCPEAVGKHVIGILLADDHHRPVLVDGKPVTAVVTVTTK